MRYATDIAFRQALEQRLLSMARRRNESVAPLRKLVAYDRLLARLLDVEGDRWILKGAMALHFRFGAQSRSTLDLDLASLDAADATRDGFLAAQRIDLGDYFAFAIESITRLDRIPDADVIRFHVLAMLAGRRFENVNVDIGIGGPLVFDPEPVHGPDLLTFAAIEPISVPVLPIEQHIAEKVQAYTQIYAGGRQSTRVKDLIDLALIPAHISIAAGRLHVALQAVFGVRGVPPPTNLLPPPAAWAIPYRQMASAVGLDLDVMVG